MFNNVAGSGLPVGLPGAGQDDDGVGEGLFLTFSHIFSFSSFLAAVGAGLCATRNL